MEFLILAYDGTDEDAARRRLDARPAHLERMAKFTAEGRILYGTAILDDKDRMIGSMLVCNFGSRTELQSWLEADPYFTGKAWVDIEVHRCRPGPGFSKPAR